MANFTWPIQHEECLCEDGPKNSHSGAKRKAQNHLFLYPGTNPRAARFPQQCCYLRKLGFFNMTMKKSDNWCTGRCPLHWGTKKLEWASQMKTMLIVFFDLKGVIMVEWVPNGQNANQKYIEVLTKLQERMRKKRLN